ncbi:MAG: AAA family ATPase [Clostridia bacterium]|nr:AAA family ATPase [Clostridia bacterium]
MRLESIHITSFGTLRDRDFTFGEGVNLVLGRNESGKSALSMFLKFVFYGLSGRAAEDGLSEKERYLSWATDEASGSVTLRSGEEVYRVERTMRASGRDECRIIDAVRNAPVMKGKVPGEVFFGLTESAFVSTVFVRQMTGAAVSGSDVTETIENLLLAGDETAGTKAALKKLDDERKTLLYKSGRGGLLYDKREEVIAAEARLREARTKSEVLRETEAELARLEAQEKEKEQLRAPLAALTKYYRVFDRKRQLDELRAAETDAEAKKRYLDGLPDAQLDRPYEAALRQSAASIESLEHTKEQSEQELLRLDRRLSQMRGADEADTDVSAVAAEGKALGRRAALCAAVGAAALVLAALAAGAAVFGYVRAGFGTLCIAAGAAAIVLAALGITLLVLRGKYRRALAAFLEKWEADDLPSLEGSAIRIIDEANERRELDKKREDMADQLRTQEIRLRVTCEEADRLASKSGAAGASLTEKIAGALSLTAAACEKREAASDAAREAAVRCSVLSSQLGGVSPETIEAEAREALGSEAGRAASEMTDEDYADAAKKLDFYDMTLPGLRQQIMAKTAKLTELKATAETPAAIEAELGKLRPELAEMEEKYAALRLAYDELFASSEDMRREVLPRIMAEAGRLMDGFSGGRYGALGADPSLHMTFRTGDETRSLAYLSAGTRDLAYVSLRLALVSVLAGENRPPVIFDESFASVDDDRLDAVAALLSGEGVGQVIWLSCRRAEAVAAEKAGANVILL